MRFVIPIELPSLTNTRMHWKRMLSLKKKQKKATKLCMMASGTAVPPMPVTVLIIRVGPRRLDDDNLQSACKYVRDTIADVIGVDDGSDQYSWLYDQRVGDYAVEVEILPR